MDAAEAVKAGLEFGAAGHYSFAKEAPDLGIRGTSALKQQGGVIREEFLRKLEGQKGVNAYIEMRDNEPIIGAWHRAFSYLVKRVKWRAVTGSGPRSEEAAEFFTTVIDDMSHTWGDFMAEVAQVPIFGWAYFEKVYKIRRGPDQTNGAFRSKYSDNKVGLRKLALRPQESLSRWRLDTDGGIRGMYQTGQDFREKYIPIEKAVLFRVDAVKNNPEGRSWLRNCYDPWFRAKTLRNFEGISAERMGAGIPFAKLPPRYMSKSATDNEKATRAYAEKLVKGIRVDEQMGIVFPSDIDDRGDKTGFDFDIISPPSRNGFDFDGAIRRYEVRMAMSLMAEMIFLGVMPTGTRSVGDNKIDVFKLALMSFLDSIEAIFNRFVVEPLMRLNGYSVEDMPYYEHGAIDNVDLVAVADFLRPMMAASAVVPTAELERKLIELVNASAGTDLPLPSEVEEENGALRPGRLSGDQTHAIVNIVTAVGEGKITRESGAAILRQAFGMSAQAAEEIIGDTGNAGINDGVDAGAIDVRDGGLAVSVDSDAGGNDSVRGGNAGDSSS